MGTSKQHDEEVGTRYLQISTDEEVIEGIKSGRPEATTDILPSPYFLQKMQRDRAFRDKVVLEALIPALQNPESDGALLVATVASICVFDLSQEVYPLLYMALKALDDAARLDPIQLNALRTLRGSLAMKYPGGGAAIEREMSQQQ